MQGISKKFLGFVLLGILFLFPNFYHDKLNIVQTVDYDEWQIRYDRLIVARLVKSRQDGVLSAGGLLGLGDTTDWNFLSKTHKHQYTVFLKDGSFDSYLIYKSNPGFQGLYLSALDRVLPLSGEQKLNIFRGLTALSSALVIAIVCALLGLEFGYFAGLLTLIYVGFSEWLILPAGSIFWNLWVYYLPLTLSIYYLAKASHHNKTLSTRTYLMLYLAILAKILFSGFDLITVVLVMTTVPLIYFSIRDRWAFKIFFERFFKIGGTLIAATLSGLAILFAQVVASEKSLARAFDHIFGRVNAYTVFYLADNPIIDSENLDLNVIHIIARYLAMPAITIQYGEFAMQILHWHLMVLFLAVTIYYVVANYNRKNDSHVDRGFALAGATWYSLMAPLSWFLVFKRHSYFHTHINTIGWQMPFTLLGFTLCGYVLQSILKRKNKPVSYSS